MVAQQGPDRVARQRGEMAEERRHHQHPRMGDGSGLAEAEQGGERGDENCSSDTAVWRRAPLALTSSTEVMPKEGRSWPSLARPSISQLAARWRQGLVSARPLQDIPDQKR